MTPEEQAKKLAFRMKANTEKALFTIDAFQHLDWVLFYSDVLKALPDWEEAAIESATRSFIEEHDLTLKDVAPFIRAALTGSAESPPIFNVAWVLGRDETVARLLKPKAVANFIGKSILREP